MRRSRELVKRFKEILSKAIILPSVNSIFQGRVELDPTLEKIIIAGGTPGVLGHEVGHYINGDLNPHSIKQGLLSTLTLANKLPVWAKILASPILGPIKIFYSLLRWREELRADIFGSEFDINFWEGGTPFPNYLKWSDTPLGTITHPPGWVRRLNLLVFGRKLNSKLKELVEWVDETGGEMYIYTLPCERDVVLLAEREDGEWREVWLFRDLFAKSIGLVIDTPPTPRVSLEEKTWENVYRNSLTQFLIL